jgi:hypothetical protein
MYACQHIFYISLEFIDSKSKIPVDYKVYDIEAPKVLTEMFLKAF